MYNQDTRSDEDVRLLFEVVADLEGPVEYMIRKLYKKGTKSFLELKVDLRAFYTAEEYSLLKKTGRQINLKDLEGRSVDIQTDTKNVSGFKVPYSFIQAMHYPGTLIKNPAHQSEDEDMHEECFLY